MAKSGLRLNVQVGVSIVKTLRLGDMMKKTGMKKKVYNAGQYFGRGRTKDIYKKGDKFFVKWDSAKDFREVSKMKGLKIDYWFLK